MNQDNVKESESEGSYYESGESEYDEEEFSYREENAHL